MSIFRLKKYLSVILCSAFLQAFGVGSTLGTFSPYTRRAPRQQSSRAVKHMIYFRYASDAFKKDGVFCWTDKSMFRAVLG